jgi:hypothetical protein
MNRFAKNLVCLTILFSLVCCQRSSNSMRYIMECKRDFTTIKTILQADADYWPKSDYPETTVKDFLSHGFLKFDNRWADASGCPYRLSIRQRVVTLWADGRNRVNEHALGDDYGVSFDLPYR